MIKGFWKYIRLLILALVRPPKLAVTGKMSITPEEVAILTWKKKLIKVSQAG